MAGSAGWYDGKAVVDATLPVLVGLDGSVGGELALEWALREAVAQGAPVLAVTAWSWDARLLAAVGARPNRQLERMRQVQEEQIARVLRRVGTAGVRIDTELGEGDPASLLLDRSSAARMLVVGSHSDPGRTAVGSVARACARLAACPVVVVPVRATA
jgi:nucleotide-binding universal stress UspA family protein